MTLVHKLIVGGVGVISLAVVVGIVIYLGNNDLSNRENILFNILLTIFSVITSLIISHFYFDASNKKTLSEIKKDYENNLRLYARKAAEKVANLSNELTRLSIYLQTDIDSDENPQSELLIKDEVIKSAVHIIGTLKSVNDRSLSDWRGVIPDEEITEQNEIIEERESEFKEFLNEYRQVLEATPSRMYIENHEENDDVRKEIKALNQKIESFATSVLGTPAITTRGANPRAQREMVTNQCPVCNNTLTYKQRPLKASIKEITCKKCSTKLYSKWSVKSGYEVSATPPDKVPIDEDTLELVKSKLPAQPWPKGTSKKIGDELDIAPSQMRRYTDELIKRGVFKVQIDGVLYEPEEIKKPTLTTTKKHSKQ